jgi:hypothetical protein
VPHAGPGQLLRATRGHREELLNGDGIRVFARGPGPDAGPALVGTRYFLVAAGFIDTLPPGGTTRSPGAFNARNFRAHEPPGPWGAPGRFVRTPRSAVLVIPGMRTDVAAGPGEGIQRLVWANALADAVSAGVDDLVAAGVHVYVVNGGGGASGGDAGLGSNPLAGPLYLLDASTYENTSFSDVGMQERYSVVPAVEARDAIGGDVWWGFAGMNHRGDFGGYDTQGTHTDSGSGTPSKYTFPTDGILASMGSDFDIISGGGVNTGNTLELFLWTPPFERDAALAAAVAARCRSFRWAWVANNSAVGIGGNSVLADESVAMTRMPAGLNATFISELSGAAAGAAVLADMASFFNL